MTTLVKFRRGTTAQNNTFTGALGEITIDTTVKSIRVHDGVTQGGSLLITTTTSLLSVNNQTISYGILSSDTGKKIRMNTVTTSTVTIPTNANQNIPVGSVVRVRQINSGNVLLSPESGVVLNVRSGLTATIAILGGEVILHKVNTNEWDVTGDLSA